MSFININSIIKIAKQAGKEILSVYQSSDFSLKLKSDKTPLTQADIASHKSIEKNLLECYPNIPIISEESAKEISYSVRKNWDKFWLVDPLDGTKEFIKRNDQFTVNIALIANHEPVLGVIYAPALDLLYFAEKGKGAYKKIDDKKILLTPSSSNKNKIRIVVSNSHLSNDTKNYIKNLQQQNAFIETISIGSSLKFCLIAEGKADIYPRLGPTMEWDTAAGQCIVNETNKKVVDFSNQILRYNKADLLNHWFIVQ